MNRRTFLTGVAAICATILISAALLAQENNYGNMTPEQAEMMQKWEAYMTPGQHHELLAKRVGDWTYTGSMWEYPGAEPSPFEGKAQAKMIMGGRYLVEKVEGPLMDMPFKGMGIFGYDNMTGSYSGAWVDNMGTGVLRYEAAPSDDGTINWFGQQPDVMTGKYVTVRSTDEMPDADHKVHRAYATGPDGKEFLMMEIRYTRASEEKKGY